MSSLILNHISQSLFQDEFTYFIPSAFFLPEVKQSVSQGLSSLPWLVSLR